MRRLGRSHLYLMTSAMALLVLLAPVQALADAVSVRAGQRGQGVRLVFEWPQAVQHSARLAGNKLRLTFARPAEADISALPERLSGWVSGAVSSPDGREITLTLVRPAQLQSFSSGQRVIVDLTPAIAATSPTPPAAQASAARDPAPPAQAEAPPREAELRLGRHSGFDRAVIGLAGRTQASRNGNTVLVTAAPQRKLSDAQLGQLRALPQVANVKQDVANQRLALAIDVKPGVSTNIFRSPQGVGLDFKDPVAAAAANEKTEANSAKPEPAKPAITAARSPEPAAQEPKAPATPQSPAPQATSSAPATPSAHGPDAAPAPHAAPAREPVKVTAITPPAQAGAAPALAPVSDGEEVASAVKDATASEEATPAQPVDAPLPPLDMTVPKDTPIAVFARGPSLFVVVVDKNTPRDLPSLVGPGWAASPRVSLLPAQGGRVIRIDMAGKPLRPTIAATESGWKLTFADAAGPTTPLPIREEPNYSLGPRLFVVAPNAASPVLFADPVVGDTLAVVPVPTAAQGVVNRVRTVQSELLPSYQGLVVRSWTEDISISITPEGVEVSAVSGFKLAERLAGEERLAELAQQQIKPEGSAADQVLPALPPMFNFETMGKPEPGKFSDERMRLQDEIKTAKNDEEKNRGWIALARLYFVYGMPTEAAVIWQDVAKQNAEYAKRPEFALVRAIAGFSSGTRDNIRAALMAISQPTTDSSLWRGMLAHDEGDFVAARDYFRPATERIWEYPEPYMSRLAIAAIDTAIETKDYDEAEALLGRLNQIYRTQKREATPAVEYLSGALNLGRDNKDSARAHFGSAAQGWNQLWRAKAELALIEADIKDNRGTPNEILDRLERLNYAWRGDALEFDILHHLARQHIAMGNFAAAFDDFGRMAKKYPTLAQKANIADEQKAVFVRIFQGDDRDRTPAFSQLAIWESYPQFRPTQPSVLDDINLYMADRVAGIDLLDRAAGFYNDVLKGTTDPLARATLGTRIAGLRLLDDKFDDAIKALDETEPQQAASQPSVLREDAKDERRQLRARAIFGQGKPDDALALLTNDYSEPATRLRADINWKTRRWSEAAATLDALIGDPPANGQPLTQEKSGLIISRATALALAGDRAGLNDLRDKFGALMAASADQTTFQMLTRPEAAGGLPDRTTLNGRVAEVDLFQKFLERYRGKPASDSSIPQGNVAQSHAEPATGNP